jgi:PBSX family phage terminase large subunit
MVLTGERPKKVYYKPSPKMRDVYHNSRFATFRLLEGAVRSGKSFVANDIAIREIQALPPCNVLISGYSISSVARNVIAEWKVMLDPRGLRPNLFQQCRDEKDEYMRISWRGLADKKFYIRGAGKDHDYKQIQGATFGYWLADELVRHCETFFDMAISRLSLPYSKALWTCNPDSPLHYVKKRIIDNPALFEEVGGYSLYKRWQFIIEDNPSLTPEYINVLKNIYSGIFYKRYILGMWVLAEGSIYDFFDEDKQTVDNLHERRADYYVVGCDYGTADPMVFGLFGVSYASKPKIWLEDEWFYDSRETGRSKSDAEYSVALKNWLSDLHRWPLRIFVPSDALSFKNELRNSGFVGVSDVDMGPGSVIDGIRVQATMLKHGDYMIDKRCKRIIEDYYGYVWDDKALLKGVEQPLHDNSHTKDMERTTLYTIYGGEGRINYEQLTRE